MFGISWWEVVVFAVIIGIPLLLGVAGIGILAVLVIRNRRKAQQDQGQVD